jgi:hypothetical protein
VAYVRSFRQNKIRRDESAIGAFGFLKNREGNQKSRRGFGTLVNYRPMCSSKLGRLNRYEEATPTLTPMFYPCSTPLFYPCQGKVEMSYSQQSRNVLF